MSKISNKMGDLNNHLFEQLERLNDPDITMAGPAFVRLENAIKDREENNS